jgi:hypothetical protein
MITTDRWPLSAAATSVLVSSRTTAMDAFKLSIKELVVVGSVALEPVTERSWRGKEKRVMHIRPGSRSVPDREPLPAVYAALFADHPEGGPLRPLVAAAVGQRHSLPDDVRKLAVSELEERGLVRLEKKLLRTVITRTPLGEHWRVEPVARLAEWRTAVDTGGPLASAAVVAATAEPGLVLLLDPATLQAIDAELHRARAGDGDASYSTYAGGGDDGVCWEDLSAIEGLSGLDAAVDPGVDCGSSDGGGGDGGGD